MPVDIHPDCLVRITNLVAVALESIRIANGKFVMRNADSQISLFAADDALPQRGTLHSNLVSYVDDHPIAEFVIDTLTDELRDAQYTDNATQPLTSIASYEDAKAVASRLMRDFVALPHEYTLTFQMPYDLRGVLPVGEMKYHLGPHVRLVRSGHDLSNEYPLIADNSDMRRRLKGQSLLSALVDDTPVEWPEAAVYLQIDACGFIGGYGGSMPDSEARRIVRAFCGLGLALRLFGTNSKYSPYPPRYHYFVHRKEADGTWRVRDRLDLDDSLSKGLDRLSLYSSDHLDTPEQKMVWLSQNLLEMKAVFSAGKPSESIRLASQWYFDSVTGPDQLLQYIQAMVVLEILLGDKASLKELGLNELLRNRCSYLIGLSQEDRADLHRIFGEIYDVRSQIVHNGKHRLNMNERVLLGRLRLICRRVIQKEVDLLRADKK